MKPILCLLALSLSGCATTLFSPETGKPLARMQSDLTDVTFSGGGVTFSAARISNSTVARANWLGGRKLADSLGSTALGFAAPGSNVGLKGAAIVAPHVFSPAIPAQ